MTFPRNLAAIGWALLALMFVSSALFGETESEQRFDPSYYNSATYAPRVTTSSAADARIFSDDTTPAQRVSEVFGQFTATDAKRIKRYSSSTAADNSIPSVIARFDRAVQYRRASSAISEPTT